MHPIHTDLKQNFQILNRKITLTFKKFVHFFTIFSKFTVKIVFNKIYLFFNSLNVNYHVSYAIKNKYFPNGECEQQLSKIEEKLLVRNMIICIITTEDLLRS